MLQGGTLTRKQRHSQQNVTSNDFILAEEGRKVRTVIHSVKSIHRQKRHFKLKTCSIVNILSHIFGVLYFIKHLRWYIPEVFGGTTISHIQSPVT